MNKTTLNRTKPEDWIAKDKEEKRKRGRGSSAIPDVGKYNPKIDDTFSLIAIK